MTSSGRDGRGKVIVDSIHGNIRLKEREVQVIDTASFQRLRRLKQLAMAQMVYPTATLSRFAHSIGALGTMIRILQAAEENGVSFSEEEVENLRLAALLHDIGHYPYSHLMEKIGRVKLTEEKVEGATSDKSLNAARSPYLDHEEIGRLIVTGQRDILRAVGGEDEAQRIADIFTRSEAADPQLSKLIHSSFDIDRLDYLLRDSYATGVPYGQIDINYLLNNLIVGQDKIVGFSEKALAALEHFLLARFFMHRVVYYHKAVFGFEESCRQLLRRLRDRDDGPNYGVPLDGEAVKEIVQSETLRRFTDAFVDDIVGEAVADANKVIQALARSIQNRTPPALLKEVVVCEETEAQYHAGKTFMQNCTVKLGHLASEFNVPLGQFLLCEPRVNVVKPPQEETYGHVAKLKQNDIQKKAFEEEGEDIKIFRRDHKEPISLMDVKHSLVAKYAKYSLQIFRLYLVYEGPNNHEVISCLKDKVQDWDKP
jgi:HD superfamily phosphohydrolase